MNKRSIYLVAISFMMAAPAFAANEHKAEKSPPPAKADKIVKEDPPKDEKTQEQRGH